MIATTPSGTRHALDPQPVGPAPPVEHLADRVGQRGDGAQAVGHARDAGVGEAQPVERVRAPCPAASAASRSTRFAARSSAVRSLEQVGGGEQGGVLVGGRRRRQPGRRRLRPPPELGDGSGRGHGSGLPSPSSRPAVRVATGMSPRRRRNGAAGERFGRGEAVSPTSRASRLGRCGRGDPASPSSRSSPTVEALRKDSPPASRRRAREARV